MTLVCLHSFARHCPRLCTLGIAFDATAVLPTSEADRTAHVCQRNVEYLGVEHSPIVTPLAAAQFLSGVFPNLKSIKTHRGYANNDENEEHPGAIGRLYCWKEVQTVLPEVPATHEEERILAQALSAA